jgi:hypothetical protein
MFFAESAIDVTAASNIYDGYEIQVTHPVEISKGHSTGLRGPARHPSGVLPREDSVTEDLKGKSPWQ